MQLATVRLQDRGPLASLLRRVLNEWIHDASPATDDGVPLEPLPVTGPDWDIHDANSYRAVLAFQRDRGLYIDGIPGIQETWPALLADYPTGLIPSASGGVVVPEGGLALTDHLAIMAINENPNLPMSVLRQWALAGNRVGAGPFMKDHRPFEITVGSAEEFDPAKWVPHIIGAGDNGVEYAAGYHTITANNGDIEAWLYTNGDLAGADITFSHENCEATANPTVSLQGPWFGSPNLEAFYEVCDAVSDRFHMVDGVRHTAWTTASYHAGDNNEKYYDSARWYGEPAILTGPKRRTADGFQILFNNDTKGIEYRFGDSDAGAAFTNLALAQAALPEHVNRRVGRVLEARG